MTKFIEGIFDASRLAWEKVIAQHGNRFPSKPEPRSIDAPHDGMLDDKSAVALPSVPLNTTERPVDYRMQLCVLTGDHGRRLRPHIIL